MTDLPLPAHPDTNIEVLIVWSIRSSWSSSKESSSTDQFVLHPFNLRDRVIEVPIDSSVSCSISSSTTFEAFCLGMALRVVSDSDSAILCFSACNSLRLVSSCPDNLSARVFSVLAKASNFSSSAFCSAICLFCRSISSCFWFLSWIAFSYSHLTFSISPWLELFDEKPSRSKRKFMLLSDSSLFVFKKSKYPSKNDAQ